MSSSTTPMNQFDLWAGAKAGYNEFYAAMGQSPSVTWEELTATRQEFWRKIIRAGIYAAKETRRRKVTKRLLRQLPARRIAARGKLDRATRRTHGYPETDKGGTR